MPEKILGLDIGDESIKAVLLAAGLRESHILKSALVHIPEGGSTETALGKLFSDDTFRADVCVTALPVWQVSFRNLTLPFKSRKKIEQVLAYELEPLIPTPLDDIIADYTITARHEKSEVLATSVIKSAVADLINLLAPYGTEISAIDIGPAPVARKLMAHCDPEEYILLLDIGKRGTQAAFFRGNTILQMRHFGFGGDTITSAIRETFGCDQSAAEERKRMGNAGEAREKIHARCAAFGADVKNTLSALALNQGLDPMPTMIYLTGGGALYAPLKEEMESFFSLPVAMADISGSDKLQADGGHPALMNQALALATRDARVKDNFNFRTGEFRLKRKDAEFSKNVRWIAILLFVILGVFGIDSSLKYHYDTARRDTLREEIRAVFHETLPGVTRIVDPVHQLRTEVARLRNPSTGGKPGYRGIRVLEILHDLSLLLPRSVDFLITSFQYEGETVTIKGQTDTFNTVDSITKALDKSEIFTNVKISSANLMKKENRVEVNLRMELRQ